MGGDPWRPIDFNWVYMIGMRIGFSYQEVQRLRWGQWGDMYACFKEQYNFETQKMIYKTMDDYRIDDPDLL